MTASCLIGPSPRIDPETALVLGKKPSTVPPVRSGGALREFILTLRNITQDVQTHWDSFAPEKREWFRLWAINELPPSPPIERLLQRFMSAVVYFAHQDDVAEFLAQGKCLREEVLRKVANAVWRATSNDPEFAKEYALGVKQLEESKTVRVNLDEL